MESKPELLKSIENEIYDVIIFQNFWFYILIL